MIRQIIKIDESKCIGCAACELACHEGAIRMIDGKAKLIREDYCDGLGDCLPACPTNAITFEEREAPAYNEAAVLAAKEKSESAISLPCGCSSSVAKTLNRFADSTSSLSSAIIKSQLAQWPIQIKLAPPFAPYFNGKGLLIAADCTAFAYGNFHNDFMRDRITLIGCPKLDEGDYANKLASIITSNEIKNIVVVRMQVPCCGGIENAAKRALQACGKSVPLRVVTIATDGTLLDER